MKFGPRPRNQLRQIPGTPCISRRNSTKGNIEKSRTKCGLKWFCALTTVRDKHWGHGCTSENHFTRGLGYFFFKQLSGNWRYLLARYYCNYTIRTEADSPKFWSERQFWRRNLISGPIRAPVCVICSALVGSIQVLKSTFACRTCRVILCIKSHGQNKKICFEIWHSVKKNRRTTEEQQY